ncbi:hypothetical protein JIN85_06625 [Luteolibacter pohnpeiensis]|uniref:Beta/gamma crystallin 'Greek key' domain-containing protein n=1 Tax=Luteolibacter pohnpeiensis TaxID=454153 RepID=A0A934VQG6_9BACT|nr:M12 family metallo-peptidase [Luteolibacter pohnpeiensis]MBK1882081.1 hypothetical protein [Luteolibacter pohnpeiensis]
MNITKKTKSWMLGCLSSAFAVLLAPGAMAAVQADVAYGWTPNQATRYGGYNALASRISTHNAISNTVHSNSGTDVYWRIAGYYQISTDNTNGSGWWLDSLANGSDCAGFRSYASGRGADLLFLCCPYVDNAGLAYQPGNHGTSGRDSVQWEIFSHEIGHNYGASHEAGMCAGTQGGTIMAACNGANIPYYSNPNLSVGGVTIGDSTHNNTSTVYNNRSTRASQASAISAVTFYQDVNYGGAMGAMLTQGYYNMADLAAVGIPNDWASSCTIPSGWTVTIYQDINFTGTTWNLYPDANGGQAYFTGYSGLNDAMTSVWIH